MVNIKEDLAMTYGSGDYTYKVDKDWGKLPDGYEFNQVAGVAAVSYTHLRAHET